MKNLTLMAYSLLFAIVSTISSSCSRSDKIEECVQMLYGNHELRRFNIRSSEITKSSGTWFLVSGSYNSETKEDSKIRFYFKTIRGEYIFKELDFNNVIIKIDSLAENPYVRFYWSKCESYPTTEIYEKAITRAVIYCKDEDFSPEVNINDLR